MTAALTYPVAGREDAPRVKGTGYADVTELGPHVEAFLASRKFAPKTRENYRYALARFCLTYPEIAPDDVTVEQLEAVVSLFPDGSHDMYYAACRSFWKWMRKRRHVSENPADLLELPGRDKSIRTSIFAEAEVEALEAQPDLRDGALMTLLFDSMIRQAEARALQLLHVNLEERYLTVVRGKGGKGRIVPIGERCARRLAELSLWDAMEPTDYLWYGYVGGTGKSGTDPKIDRRHIDSSRFYRWWYGCLDTVGIAYAKGKDGYGNPHQARHTGASRWLKNNGNVAILSRVMGHSSIAVTVDTYGHFMVADLQAEVARLEVLRGESSRMQIQPDETPA